MIFWKIDSLPIIQWDESRFALTALEITQSGNPLIPLYEGKPDFWNSKPPLNAALQAGCMNILGYNSLAVRLPVALAVLGTLFILVYFSQKVLNDNLVGIIGVLALLASPGYWGIHIAYSGDAVAILVFLQTLYILSFFGFVWLREKRWLRGIFIGMLLAGLTKGIAAFLPVPALGLFALMCELFYDRKALRKPQLYLIGAAVLGLLGCYYAYRDVVTPGYLDAVSFNEWGGRFMREEGSGQSTSSDHLFYLKNLLSDRLFPVAYFLPLFVLGIAFLQDKKQQMLAIYVFLTLTVFLLLISLASTHHHWYDAPMYPMIALLVGLGSKGMVQLIHRSTLSNNLRFVFFFGIIALFAMPIVSSLHKRQGFDRVQHFETEGLILMEINKHVPASDTVWVLKAVDHPYHWDQILFYQKANRLEGGPVILPVAEVDSFKMGFYLSSDSELLDELKQQKGASLIRGWRNAELIQLK